MGLPRVTFLATAERWVRYAGIRLPPLWRGLQTTPQRGCLLFVLAVGALSGCSSGDAPPLTEVQAVSATIENIADSASQPRFLSQRFVAGAAPPMNDLRRYSRYSFQPASPPTVSGTNATAKVTVIDLKTNREAGVVEWSLVKDKDEWKLKSAPLP